MQRLVQYTAAFAAQQSCPVMQQALCHRRWHARCSHAAAVSHVSEPAPGELSATYASMSWESALHRGRTCSANVSCLNMREYNLNMRQGYDVANLFIDTVYEPLRRSSQDGIRYMA